jgi:hypothetical protein
MKALILSFALLASLSALGCEKPPAPVHPTCDYCKIGRADAKVYPCLECKKTHFSCGKEVALKALDLKAGKDGLAAGRAIKNCPGGVR